MTFIFAFNMFTGKWQAANPLWGLSDGADYWAGWWRSFHWSLPRRHHAHSGSNSRWHPWQVSGGHWLSERRATSAQLLQIIVFIWERKEYCSHIYLEIGVIYSNLPSRRERIIARWRWSLTYQPLMNITYKWITNYGIFSFPYWKWKMGNGLTGVP